MDGAAIWAIVAAVAVVGGWLSYRKARRSGKGSVVGFLLAFLAVIVVIVVGSLIVTLLQPK